MWVMSPRVRRLLATLLLASPALAGDGHPFPVEKTDAEWRAQLGPERFHVMREQGTEAAYTGKGWNEHRPGVYRCAACGQLLFTSDAKFDSGTGWPSFTRPATPTSVVERPDRSLGMARTEVRLQPLRQPPRARVRRRPGSDGAALLHERDRARLPADEPGAASEHPTLGPLASARSATYLRGHMRTSLCVGLVLALAVSGCKKGGGEAGGPLRLGFFPNLTHAQALVGNDEGLYAKALDGKLETKQFNAGPAAMEALLAGSLDVSYVGSGPAVMAYLRSDGQLKVIAGSAAGGAVLVTKGISDPSELKGKRVASPQLGNTQDVALRVWLKSKGLKVLDRPGPDGVAVTPLANSDILGLFQRGDLAGAWVPEPWGARLVAEAGGKILVDERSLWPEGKFATTVLVASRKALETRREDVKKLLRVHLELTRRAKGDKQKFAREANAAFGKITGKSLPEPVLQDAFSRIDFTTDPLAAQLATAAKNAHELGFVPSEDVSGLVDGSLLKELEAGR